MERHMNNIGIRFVEDLVGRDPEELYRLDCLKKRDLKRIGAPCILQSMSGMNRKN